MNIKYSDTMVVIVMGVSGSGKSTIGNMLAEATGGDFFDGDDFHPPANIAKMHAGHPLTDEDRIPWLNRLRELIVTQEKKKTPSFIACSALKDTYRTILCNKGQDPLVEYVFLQGSFELIKKRIDARKDHFMPESLLRSQFDTLQAPDGAIIADMSKPAEAVVAYLLTKF